MSQHLQQLDVTTGKASRAAAVAISDVSLKANIALILVLVLVLIPTVSGVAAII